MFPLMKNKALIPTKKFLISLSLIFFLINSVIPISFAQSIAGLNLPNPGEMVSMSPAFQPALMKGMTINPQNPLLFDFLIDVGQSNLDDEAFKEESTKLIKYFLASLTVPEEELWVNLSPYENDRIIPDFFGETEMGRDLLAQDYILKQLTASVLFPENDLGKEFWQRVYAKTQAQFGTTDIPINTFNKIWIVPDKAVVYEHENTAFIVESHLKVMLEEDYVALNKSLGIEQYGLDSLPEGDAKDISGLASQVIKEIVIPEIEKEVNEGKNFANLRQIYQSMILSSWYKIALQETLLGQVYADQNKTKGIDLEDKQVKFKIYDQYLKAFNKGVYDYIKEDYDPNPQDIVYRKYISGGVDAAQLRNRVREQRVTKLTELAPKQRKSLDNAILVENTQEGKEEQSNLRDVAAGMTEVPKGSSVSKVERANRESEPVRVKNSYYEGNGEITDQGYRASVPVSKIIEGLARREPTKDERDQIQGALTKAADFSSKIDPQTNIVILNSGGDINFGIAKTRIDNREVIAIESGFLDEVRQKGNPNDMLTRSVIAASVGKQAEIDYVNRDDQVFEKVNAAGLDWKGLYDTLRNDYFPEAQSGQARTTVQESGSVFQKSLDKLIPAILNRGSGFSIKDTHRVRVKESDPNFNVNDPKDGSEPVKVGVLRLENKLVDQSAEELALRAIAELGLDRVVIIKNNPNDEISRAREKELQGLIVYSDLGEVDSRFNELLKANVNRPSKIEFVHLTPPDLEAITRLHETSNQIDLGKNQVRAGVYFRDAGDAIEADKRLPQLEEQLPGFITVVPGINLPFSNYATQKALATFSSASRTTDIPGIPKSTVNLMLEKPQERAKITEASDAIQILSAAVESADPNLERSEPVREAVRQIKTFKNVSGIAIPQPVSQFVDRYQDIPSITQYRFGDFEMPQSQLNILYSELDRLRLNSPDTAAKLLRALQGAGTEEFSPRDRLNLVNIISKEGYISEDQGTVITQMLSTKSIVRTPRPEDFQLSYPKVVNPKIQTPRIDFNNIQRIAPANKYPKREKYGGINLNPKLLDLQIKRDDNGVPLPLDQQPLNDMQIDGFLPFIIQITPVTDLQLLLGINSEPDTEIGSKEVS